MTDLHYPSDDEVNELLEAADAFPDLHHGPEYMRLCYAAAGCKAEAEAFAVLEGLVQVAEEA